MKLLLLSTLFLSGVLAESGPPPVFRPCPTSWLTFERPQGRWCVAVFKGQLLNQEAEDECKRHNATLTGLQNSVERLRLADEGGRVQRELEMGKEGTGIRLGGRRKSLCPKVDVCPPSATFDWTDGHTTGLDGFGWGYGDPNGSTVNALVAQDCIQLYSFPYPEVNVTWTISFHGDLDDVHCLDKPMRLYACGKRA